MRVMLFSQYCRSQKSHLILGHIYLPPLLICTWIGAPATHLFGAQILLCHVLLHLRPLAPCCNTPLYLYCPPVLLSMGPSLGNNLVIIYLTYYDCISNKHCLADSRCERLVQFLRTPSMQDSLWIIKDFRWCS